MLAVIQTGGKQYVVKPGSILRVERLEGEIGQKFSFKDILENKGATVSATLLSQIRGPKLIIFKKRRRKNYRRKTGHRQNLSVIKIDTIE